MATERQINRAAAMKRRRALRINLSTAYGAKFVEQKDIERTIGFDFPEALVVGLQGNTLILGRDAGDDTDYELDVWAFALMNKMPKIQTVRFAVQIPSGMSEEDIRMEKWFKLFVWRLAFMRQSEPGRGLALEYVAEARPTPSAVGIPEWQEVLEEGRVLRPYKREGLRSRGSKSERNAEDQEQDRIIGILRAGQSNPFKEFPIIDSCISIGLWRA